MKITVRRTGGVVGFLPGRENVPGHQPVSIETADLGPDKCAQVERLVQEAGIIDRPPPPPHGYPGGVRLITVETDGKEHAARFREGEVPDNVQRLIDAVHAYSK